MRLGSPMRSNRPACDPTAPLDRARCRSAGLIADDDPFLIADDERIPIVLLEATRRGEISGTMYEPGPLGNGTLRKTWWWHAEDPEWPRVLQIIEAEVVLAALQPPLP